MRQIANLVKRLKFSLKCFLKFPPGLCTLKACYFIATGQKSRALIEATFLIRNHPRNWSSYLFLINEYCKDSRDRRSILLVCDFLDSFSSANNEYSDNKQYAKQIINSYFLSLYDSRDFADLRFIKSDKINKPMHFCLNISYIGRFSNFIIQLANAISIASEYGIKEIYIHKSEVLSQVFAASKSIFLHQLRIRLHFTSPPPGLVLDSLFFHVRRQNAPVFSEYSVKQLIEYVKPFTLYAPSLCPAVQAHDDLDSKTLTIHIRSGDIFSATDVHGDYGQPPLSYYILAINDFSPEYVVLVYENERNPIIEPLQQFLRSMNIGFRVQSSSLSEDVKILSSCTSLVVSRGTFALGPMSFSQSLKKIYCFSASLETDPYFTLHLSKNFHNHDSTNASPAILEILDKSSNYFLSVCSSNWTNSETQRHLMVNYSIHNLHLIERL